MEKQIKKKLKDLGYEKKTIKKILDWYDSDKVVKIAAPRKPKIRANRL